MTEPERSVTLTLSSDEALVLFAFVQRFSDTDRLAIDDQAEQRALWNLCCILEKSGVPFQGTYQEALLAARERLRDAP
ncbi:hypothetical protein F2P45_25010 [Massilia sp. CCM 8733]|uniref:Uncharacterized protein n=1 Tax=Massilia mucilaginosa TaxID=2609282 RepID=A0ABX0NZ06_9BURK|nr:hypothetical protein [Massilia mucilaginosa]NHZ92238.1 hypothetical protein [Massilia mucilaginosa]